MRFFDRKGWQLKQKIKDLRNELKAAEREGRFVREQGLFFAELEDMGAQTIALMGTMDAHAAQEVSVIKSFFERNGFEVERLELNKGFTEVEEAELAPPPEMLKYVAELIEHAGWEVIDDGDKERPFSAEQKFYPVSVLIHAVGSLFCQKVYDAVAGTRIKNNKEGNRLLSWMPSINNALKRRANPQAVASVRSAFDDAYAYFYEGGHDTDAPLEPVTSALEETTETSAPNPLAPVASPKRKKDEPRPRSASKKPERKPERKAGPSPRKPGSASSLDRVQKELTRELKNELQKALTRVSSRVSGLVEAKLGGLQEGLTASPSGAEVGPATASPADGQQIEKLARNVQVNRVLGAMYHSLIRANGSRCVHNTEALLHFVNRLFEASATCVLKRAPNNTMTVFAQAGKKLSWGETGSKGYAISTTIIRDCLIRRSVVTSSPMTGAADPSASMVQFNIDTAAAAPVVIDDEIVAVIYVDRREAKDSFTPEESEVLGQIAKVFQEFPDLTLALPAPS